MSQSTQSSSSTGKLLAIGAAAAAVAVGAYYLFSGDSKPKSSTNKKKKRQPSTDPLSSSQTFSSPPKSASPGLPTTPTATSQASGFFNQPTTGEQKSYAKLGSEAAQRGKHDKAIEYFSLAIQEQDTNHKLYTNRANVYIGLKRFEDALRDASKSLSFQNSASAFLAKGSAHHGLEQFQAAIDAFEAALNGSDATPAHKTTASRGLEKSKKALQDMLTLAAELAHKEADRVAEEASIDAPSVTLEGFGTPATTDATATTTATEPVESEVESSHVFVPSPPAESKVESEVESSQVFVPTPEPEVKQPEVEVVEAPAATTATETPAPAATTVETVAPATTESATSSATATEVEFNPDNHSNGESSGDDSTSSGVIVNAGDIHSDTETNDNKKLSNSEQLKESGVFVQGEDLSSPKKLSASVKDELQTTVGKKEHRKQLQRVQKDITSKKQPSTPIAEETGSAASSVTSFPSPSLSPSADTDVENSPVEISPANATSSTTSSTVQVEAEPEPVTEASTTSAAAAPASAGRGKRNRGKKQQQQAEQAGDDESATSSSTTATPAKSTPGRRGGRQPSIGTPARRQPSSDLTQAEIEAGPTPLTPPPPKSTGWSKMAAKSASKAAEAEQK